MVESAHVTLLVAITALVSTFMAAAGTWAVLRYQVSHHERAVSAAHTRLDDHHERLIRLEERSIEGSKRIEAALSALSREIGLLRDELRRHIEREVTH
jgi:hypothetical protein